jgi:DnaJ-class molecular chaperone
MSDSQLTKDDLCSSCNLDGRACVCFDYDDELDCTWCGGEGEEENDDPFWYGFDVEFIPCGACNGTGLRKHQTVF